MAVKTSEDVSEDRVLLHTNWTGYIKILQALGEAPGVRVTYDQGDLEIMTIGDEHGHLTQLLGDLLKGYMLHTGISFRSGGAQTFKRKDKDKGFEPDNCFWTDSARVMVGVKKWIPHHHPPPDVAVEVEITSGLIKRLGIYAALGIPEVWWYRKEKVAVLRLSESGGYDRVQTSPTFPHLPPAVVAEHLGMADRMTDSEILQEFQRWLQQHVAGRAS